MTQLQSFLVLAGIVLLASSPWFFAKARQYDREQKQIVSEIVPLEPGVARHMYGEAVGYEASAMIDYDESPALQAMWEAEAGYKLRR